MALMCIRPSSRLRAALASLLLVFLLSCTAYLTHHHEFADEGSARTTHCPHCLGFGTLAGTTVAVPLLLVVFIVGVLWCPPARSGIARFLPCPYPRGPPVPSLSHQV